MSNKNVSDAHEILNKGTSPRDVLCEVHKEAGMKSALKNAPARRHRHALVDPIGGGIEEPGGFNETIGSIEPDSGIEGKKPGRISSMRSLFQFGLCQACRTQYLAGHYLYDTTAHVASNKKGNKRG